jgi:hypothetical protein
MENEATKNCGKLHSSSTSAAAALRCWEPRRRRRQSPTVLDVVLLGFSFSPKSTMKFTNIAVLAVVAPAVAAFAPTANQRFFAKNVVSKPSATHVVRGAMSMDLSDLEKKATGASLEAVDPYAKGKKKSSPPKAEKPKPEKKEKKAKKSPEPESLLKEAPAPAPAPKAAKYEKLDVPKKEKAPKAPSEPKPKAEKPVKAPKEPKPKVEKAPKAKPAPKPKAPIAPKSSDPAAVPAGVALGAAPLLLAPVVALSAGRGVLSKTKERREKIQAEIAAAEARKAKKVASAEIDGGGLTAALVSIFFLFVPPALNHIIDWCDMIGVV